VSSSSPLPVTYRCLIISLFLYSRKQTSHGQLWIINLPNERMQGEVKIIQRRILEEILHQGLRGKSKQFKTPRNHQVLRTTPKTPSTFWTSEVIQRVKVWQGCQLTFDVKTSRAQHKKRVIYLQLHLMSLFRDGDALTLIRLPRLSFPLGQYLVSLSFSCPCSPLIPNSHFSLSNSHTSHKDKVGRWHYQPHIHTLTHRPFHLSLIVMMIVVSSSSLPFFSLSLVVVCRRPRSLTHNRLKIKWMFWQTITGRPTPKNRNRHILSLSTLQKHNRMISRKVKGNKKRNNAVMGDNISPSLHPREKSLSTERERRIFRCTLTPLGKEKWRALSASFFLSFRG
jgi:hypothetical protein